jgi:hypothetical protein
MDIFFDAPCLSNELPTLKANVLYDVFKGADKRVFSQYLHKFIHYNHETLAFLDVHASILGIDPDVELSFETNKYIGAIPLRSPVNGKQIGDLLVYPRFAKERYRFLEMTQLLTLLDEQIEPDYLNTMPLASGPLVQPPQYYDAIKYIQAFQTASRENWQKFRTRECIYDFPKSNTNWQKYILKEHLPENKLMFPVRDNELSTHHLEWQQAKYVFDLAKEELAKPTTPVSFRFKVLDLIKTLAVETYNVQPVPVQKFIIRVSDPLSIKQLKTQGNIFLNRKSKEVSAWRIDIAQLFERYAQYILKRVINRMPARFYSNPKFSAYGDLPAWGMRYLEPDALIETETDSIVIDAKYKSHLYNKRQASEKLQEAYRADLHQILAYSSFSTSKNKTGILIYPAEYFSYQISSYTNHYNGARNKAVILGLPFESQIKPQVLQALHDMFNQLLAQTPVS